MLATAILRRTSRAFAGHSTRTSTPCLEKTMARAHERIGRRKAIGLSYAHLSCASEVLVYEVRHVLPRARNSNAVGPFCRAGLPCVVSSLVARSYHSLRAWVSDVWPCKACLLGRKFVRAARAFSPCSLVPAYPLLVELVEQTLFLAFSFNLLSSCLGFLEILRNCMYAID